MLWVTFGYAEARGMTVTVGANMKDENCFAEREGLAAGARLKGAANGRIGEKGRPRDLPGEPLLLGTRESTVAKLTERHFSAHRLAVRFARILHGETLALRIDLVFDRHVIALDRTGHLRLP